jgi:hypothetical protein
MRRISITLIVCALGVFAGAAFQAAATGSQVSIDSCGAASAAQLRTTLYFGMTRPTGAVSELEWQIFLRDEVTKRFPGGFTVWEAQGQWQSAKGSIDQERSKVLLLVHSDSTEARASVQQLIERYRKQFDQESVLWETARVCISS